jgi:hypothetical protein
VLLVAELVLAMVVVVEEAVLTLSASCCSAILARRKQLRSARAEQRKPQTIQPAMPAATRLLARTLQPLAAEPGRAQQMAAAVAAVVN